MFKYYCGIGFLATVVVVLIFIVFVTEGTPMDQKAKNQDNVRSQLIQSLSSSINNYAYTNKKLPDNLNNLQDVANFNDPQTKQSFTYKINSMTTYSLCADFASKITKNDKTNLYAQMYNNYNSTQPNPYVHEKGFACIDYSLPENTIQTINQ